MTTPTPPAPPLTQPAIRHAVNYIRANPARLSIVGASVVETAALREQAVRDWRMVLVAALRECSRPTPSWPDIADSIGCVPATAMRDWERFCALPWRDRYAWLDLVERVVRATDETSK